VSTLRHEVSDRDGLFSRFSSEAARRRLVARIQPPFASIDRTENRGTENSDVAHLVADYNSELVADYIVSLPQHRMDSSVEAFSLELEMILLSPSAPIAQETTFPSAIHASLNASAQVPSSTKAPGRATAALELKITGLVASDANVFWTSESGVFLTPEPSASFMVGRAWGGREEISARQKTGSARPE